MINVNDFKTGVTINHEGNLYQVLEYHPSRTGKHSVVVKTKLKNLRTGTIAEYSFISGTKVPTAHVEKQKMLFLYSKSNIYTFMNIETYEQVELEKSKIENETKFLKENLEVLITFHEGEMLGIELPEKIDFKVTQTEPAVKGNTTNNAQKDAIIETGMLVKVPQFIELGDEIIISTKDGKYVSKK